MGEGLFVSILSVGLLSLAYRYFFPGPAEEESALAAFSAAAILLVSILLGIWQVIMCRRSRKR